MPPENVDILEATKVNFEIWKQIALQTKSLAFKWKKWKRLILKSLSLLSKVDVVELKKVTQSLTRRHLLSSSTMRSANYFFIKMPRIPSKGSSTLATTITNYAESKEFIVLDSTWTWQCLKQINERISKKR